MARSHRHTPILGMTTAASEHQDKQKASRRLRRVVRQQLRTGALEAPLPLLREVTDVWTFPKDGKQYVDARRHPEWMRK